MLIDIDRINYKVIDFRINWKSERLPNGTLSQNIDEVSGENYEIKKEKIILRLRHLSEVLYDFYEIFKENKDFYNKDLLRYISNEIIKEWLWIDCYDYEKLDEDLIMKYKYLTEIFYEENLSREDFFNIVMNFRKKYGKKWKRYLIDSKKIEKNDAKGVEDIKRSYSLLSKILFKLYKIYREDKNLYGKRFLAFVGNEVVREWPKKDYPFESKKYRKGEKAIYEHWTPISFFRDFLSFDGIEQIDFYDALVYYYRIINISLEENNMLDNLGFKTTRPFETYDNRFWCKNVFCVI